MQTIQYAGEVVLTGDKAGQVWIIDDEERFFQKLHKSPVLGGLYETEVTVKDDSVSVSKDMTFVRKDELLAEQIVRHQDARTWLAKLAVERKIKKEADDFGDLTLAQIREQMSRRHGAARMGLLAAVTEYVTR